MKSIPPHEAKALLDNGSATVYLDVRSQAEFAQGHVPGAWNVPLLDLDEFGRMVANDAFVRVVEANFPRDAAIIVGCKSGPRSEQAVQIMNQMGYTGAVNMSGGLHGQMDFMGNMIEPGWATLGLPMAASPEVGRSYVELRDGSAGTR